jgi:predicted permease
MVWNELRIAFRKLSRSGGFLLAASLVLALGLGANLVLFHTIYSLLWKPLNYPEPDRLITSLVDVMGPGKMTPAITINQAVVVRQQVPAVDAVGVYTSGIGLGRDPSFVLTQNAEPISFSSMRVNSEYFRALGIRPIAGRLFGAQEDRSEGTELEGVITESAWRGYFNSDPSVVNRAVAFKNSGKPVEVRILGIVPDSAILDRNGDAPDEPRLLMPLAWLAQDPNGNSNLIYRGVFRLRPGATIAQASAQINAAFRPTLTGRDFHYTAAPLRQLLAPVDREMLFLLYGGSCLLLLLTCINLANMFLVHYLERVRDTAMRLALGAPMASVLRLNLIEALYVCALGTTMAFGLVRLAQPLIEKLLPLVRNLGPHSLAIGWTEAAVGIGACLAIACAVSLAPAWILRRTDLVSVLAMGGRGNTTGRQWSRTGLVVGQIAIAMTLLSVAAVLGRSFASALHVDPGMDAQHVVTFQARFPESTNTYGAGVALCDQLRALPNVQHAAFADESFLGLPSATISNPNAARPVSVQAPFRLVGAGYLEALGAKLDAGRGFTAEEVETAASVVMLNRQAAQALFPGENPIGKVVDLGFMGRRSTVMGLVENMRDQGLDKEPLVVAYMPWVPLQAGQLKFFVLVTGDPAAAISTIKDRIAQYDKNVIVRKPHVLEDDMRSTIEARMTSSTLIGGFALLGLIVSAAGLYGAMATRVQRQYRDIGVRLALGATIGAAVRGIVSEGMLVVGCGMALGVVGALASAPLVKHLVYQVRAIDASSMAAAAVLLALAAGIALVPPVLRIRQVNPVDVLRAE